LHLYEEFLKPQILVNHLPVCTEADWDSTERFSSIYFISNRSYLFTRCGCGKTKWRFYWV